MSVDALGHIMLCQIERTELSFIEEHIEVIILSVVVDKWNKYLLLIMSVWAKISVRTRGYTIWEMRAKTSLVFLIVIVLFDKWMREDAGLSLRAFLLLFYVSAHVGLIEISVALSIFCVVIVGTMLVIMFICDIAWVYFEDFEI